MFKKKMFKKRVFNKICFIISSLVIIAACTSNEGSEKIQPVINIHINQVAFELAGPKVAIITSSESLE